MVDKLTVGSLFSGIGGLELGLERTDGFKTLWQVEIDDYANKVLAKHWPDVPRFRDVQECGAHNLAPVDLICGGFPCQDVSLAGARAGLDGKRSTLWSEFARLICEIRPRWVLAENVPGLLSSDDGRFFGNILRDLAAAGYDAEWRVLSAANMGAPHLRERVFLIAYPHGIGLEARAFQDEIRPEVPPKWVWTNGDALPFTAFGNTYVGIPPHLRVDDGVPYQLDRLRCLGNAVVPQCAEAIGRMILDAEYAIDKEREMCYNGAWRSA
jgi:DNA (cytosine-5)-methyltransferase 1